jgi:hypothetical protein
MPSKTQYTFESPFIGGKNLLIPNTVKWLARFTLAQFKKDPGNDAIDFAKAEALLDSLFTRKTENPETRQRPTHALCPNLRAKPFWESEDDILLKRLNDALNNHFEIIKKEYEDANKNGSQAKVIGTGKAYLEADSWLNIRLGNLGNYFPKAIELFPETCKLLQTFGRRIFSAEFIIMEPDTTLPPHTDATNAYLVCHLGLDVPDNCGLQVKDHLIDFHERDVIFFDQSFVHSAWNKGERTRVNLLLTFFHPEISDDECELIFKFIQKLQTRCLFFLPVILIEYLLLKLLRLFKRK